MKNIQEIFKHEPRTAEHSIRKKIEAIKKSQHSYSQNRPRDRKNFKVRSINKEMLFVHGHGQNPKERESLHLSEKIQPPIIQTHLRNGYPGIEQYVMKKNYWFSFYNNLSHPSSRFLFLNQRSLVEKLKRIWLEGISVSVFTTFVWVCDGKQGIYCNSEGIIDHTGY